MKTIIWKLVLPLTVISFTVFTKWWYVDIDGYREMLNGFPLPFVTSGWHTSLSLQIFLVEFVADFLVNVSFWFLVFYTVHDFYPTFSVHRIVSRILWIISGSIVTVVSFWLVVTFQDNVFYLRRPFPIEVVDTGYRFIWQEEHQPDVDK